MQRVVAAALLSRPPLLLPALSPFERSYYAYQRRIHRALSKPAESATSWFFKRGSAAEKAFTSFDQRVGKEEQKGDMVERRAYEMAGEEVEGAPELMHRETEADRVGDEHSLERRADRTLYLLLKKKRDQHAWQFRALISSVQRNAFCADFRLQSDAAQGGVEGQESLVQAAQRELHEETGPNVDVWPVGRVPAGAYEYAFPAEHVKKFPAHAGATVRPMLPPVVSQTCACATAWLNICT